MRKTAAGSVSGARNKEPVIEWANAWGPVALADMNKRHGSVFICNDGRVAEWKDSDPFPGRLSTPAGGR